MSEQEYSSSPQHANQQPAEQQPQANPPELHHPPDHPVRRRLHYAFDVILGAGLAIGLGILAVSLIFALQASRMVTVSNNWIGLLDYGQPNENALQRATDAYILPAAVPPEEAIYYYTTTDGNGKTLNSQNDYVIHFPAGQLPPANAFWSITISNPRGLMIANTDDIYHVGSETGFATNEDGSVDFYVQESRPEGRENNWLPAPDGDFKLWLRIYLPTQSVLDGQYQVPAVTEVN